MASEIRISAALSQAKNGSTMAVTGSASQDQTGDDSYQGTQSFTTTESAVSLGPCAQAEYLFIKNLDGANNLIVGQANPIVLSWTIKPGKFALFPLSSGTVYAKSSASTVKAQIGVSET